MTGFGKAEVKVGNKKFVAEIRSLNSKQLDLSVKMPMAYRAAEFEVRSVVSKALVRGKVDVLISYESEAVQTGGVVNKDIFRAYLHQVTDALNFSGVDAAYDAIVPAVLRMPNVLSTESEVVSDEELAAIVEAVKLAAEQLDAFRVQEGNILIADLLARVTNIENYRDAVTPFEAARADAVRTRIREGIAKEEQEWLEANDKLTTTAPKHRSEKFNAMTTDELAKQLPTYQQKLDERVFGNARDIVNRYDGRIHSWDVVNECYLDYRDKVWVPGSKFAKTPRYGLMPGDYVYRSFDLVSKLNNGGAKLNINETQSDSHKKNADIYTGAIKHLLERGAKIDMIGIQMHLMRKHRNAELVAQGKPIYRTRSESRHNLPMCMSEITIT